MPLITELQNIAVELGGYAGTVSSAVVTYAYKRFKSIEVNAKAALTLAENCQIEIQRISK